MKAKGFLFTKKQFIKNGKLISSPESDMVSVLTFGLTKKDAIQRFVNKKNIIQRFVKRKKATNWAALTKQDWIIKKVTVKIK